VEFEVYCNCHLISGKKLISFSVDSAWDAMHRLFSQMQPKKKMQRVQLGELWLGLRFIRAKCINAFCIVGDQIVKTGPVSRCYNG